MSVTSLTHHPSKDSKALIPFIGLLASGGAETTPTVIYLLQQPGTVTMATLLYESQNESLSHFGRTL